MSNLIPFLTYVIVTTFTPGPNNIMSMTNAMRYGYKRTTKFIAGIFVGFFIVLLISGLLNVAMSGLLPSLRKWLNILGAGYMLYLAFHIIISKPVDEQSNASSMNTFNTGFSMQFFNIKVILYGITVFSLFIINTYQDPIIISVFALLLACVGFLATTSWALGGNVFRKILKENYQLFNVVMGGLLIYTAIASLL